MEVVNVCQKISELYGHFYHIGSIWTTEETQDYSPVKTVFLVSSCVSRKTFFFLMALDNTVVSGCWSHAMSQKLRPLLDLSKIHILSPQNLGTASVSQMGDSL